jgi:hypothetical protein
VRLVTLGGSSNRWGGRGAAALVHGGMALARGVARARGDGRRLRCMAARLQRAAARVTGGAGYQRGHAATAPVHGGTTPTRSDGRWLHGSRRRVTVVWVFPPLHTKWSAVAPG